MYRKRNSPLMIRQKIINLHMETSGAFICLHTLFIAIYYNYNIVYSSSCFRKTASRERGESLNCVKGDGAAGCWLLLYGNRNAPSRKCTFKGEKLQRSLCIHLSLTRGLLRLTNTQQPLPCAKELFGQF